MKAIVQTRYGSPEVLELKELERPRPEAHEICVRVHTSTVTAADCMMRRGIPRIGRLYLGLFRPKRQTPGIDFSGVVEAVGDKVTRFQVGDAVFGETTGLGCYAEYVCMPENDVVTLKPEALQHEQAAPVPSGVLTSLHFLKNLAKLQAGQRILICGASGGVGTYAVQIARHLGAHVTGVCSTRHLETVRDLGAHRVIDYTQQDLAQETERYDVLFDAVGKYDFFAFRHLLTKQGVYMSLVMRLSPSLLWYMLRTAFGHTQKVKFSATGMLPASKRLAFLEEGKTLMMEGSLRSVIDRGYPLAELPEAQAYVDTGKKTGNVLVHIQG